MGNVWLGEKDAIDVTDAVKWKGLLGEEHTYWEDEDTFFKVECASCKTSLIFRYRNNTLTLVKSIFRD